ncbi:hypothetical protein BC567DRAFT_238829 [Phyllosticta citribraziliensis]
MWSRDSANDWNTQKESFGALSGHVSLKTTQGRLSWTQKMSRAIWLISTISPAIPHSLGIFPRLTVARPTRLGAKGRGTEQRHLPRRASNQIQGRPDDIQSSSYLWTLSLRPFPTRLGCSRQLCQGPFGCYQGTWSVTMSSFVQVDTVRTKLDLESTYSLHYNLDQRL